MRLTCLSFKNVKTPLTRGVGRAWQREETVQFRELLPLQIKNKISMFACLKQNNFVESLCSKEIKIFKDCDDQHMPMDKKPFTCPENSKLLRVALIGMPNAGKSTLINTLMQYEVCPASKRVHTTRKPQRVIFLEDNVQIVFIDTPGVVSQNDVNKFNFSKEFASGPRKSIKGADIVGVIHDISPRIVRNKLNKRITSLLKQYPEKEVFLILNKVDVLPTKRRLLDTLRILTNGVIGGKPVPFEVSVKPTKEKKLNTEDILQRAAKKLEQREKPQSLSVAENNQIKQKDDSEQVEFLNPAPLDFEDNEADVRGWSNFQEVFMISSITGDGVESLKDYLVKKAKDAKWDFSEEVLTDYSPPDLSILILKSKLLDYVPEEAPYKVTPVLQIWEENDKGGLILAFELKCPNSRILKMVIGARGTTISQITQETERGLMKLLRRNVSLHIKVTCPEENDKK